MISTSQAGQDQFVYELLGHKTNGTYLEIGAGPAKEFNNTYSLECLGWHGLSIDKDAAFSPQYAAERKNPFLVADVLVLYWDRVILEHKFLQTTVDYLSFDVDEATLPALKRFPFNKIRFKVATVEHDFYRCGDAIRQSMRAILKAAGYQIVCADVKVYGVMFEDWWVNPKYIAPKLLKKCKCEEQAWEVILAMFTDERKENVNELKKT